MRTAFVQLIKDRCAVLISFKDTQSGVTRIQSTGMATSHQSSGASSSSKATLRDILPTAYASSSPAAWVRKGIPPCLRAPTSEMYFGSCCRTLKSLFWMDSKTCSARVQDPSTTSAWSYLANLNLADASVQLASIDLQIRERLYAEYCAQCADLAPYLHQRGRR